MLFWTMLVWTLTTPSDSLWTLVHQEKYAEAIELGQALVSEGRADRTALLGLAFAYRATDRLDQAEAIYQTMVSANPRDVDALLGLALVLSWQGQLDSAIAVYHRVRQIEPGNREALLGLARTYGWADRLATAQAYADTAIAWFPDDPEVYQLAGEIQVWADHLEQAIPLYQQAMALEPDNPVHGVRLAQVYEWLGDYRRARALYAQVLAMDPTNPEAQAGMQRVRAAMGYRVELGADNTREQDGSVRGDYRRMVVGIGGQGPWPALRWRVRVYGTQNTRGETTNPWLLVAPELRVRLGSRGSLGGHIGWNPTHPSAWTYGVSLSWRLPGLSLQAEHTRDILEPVALILFQNTRLRATLRTWGAQFKASAEYGTIPSDTNRRRLLDFTVTRDIRLPWLTVKPLYSFGFMAYDHGSPKYYSPDRIQRHALGLGIFRSFGRGYFYADYAQSVWVAEGTPGTRNGSLEVGYGDFYVSVSYFATTENYEAWTVKVGHVLRIPR